MGKKRVDVRLRLELMFDEKIAVSKEMLKSYFEDRIKGFKLKSFLSFKQEKDVTLAELDSNLLKILLLAEAPEKKPGSSTKLTESDLGEKLSSSAQLLVTQLRLQKVAAGVLKAAEAVSAQSVVVSEQLKKMKSEAAAVPAKSNGSSNKEEAGQLNLIIEDLNSELIRLCKENGELKDKSKKPNFGEDVLYEQIKKLEQQLKAKDAMIENAAKEMDVRVSQLGMQVIEKDDQIKDLKKALTTGDKGKSSVYSEDYELTQAKIQNLEHKCNAFDEEVGALKKQSSELENSNKKLMGELAASLKELSGFEGSVAAKEYRVQKMRADQTSTGGAVARIEKLIQDRLNGSTLTLRTALDKMQDVVSKISVLRKHVQELKQALLEHIAKLKQQEGQLLEAKQLADSQDRTIKSQAAEIQTLKGETATLSGSKAKLESDLGQTRTQLSATEEQRKGLAQELSLTQTRVTELAQLMEKEKRKEEDRRKRGKHAGDTMKSVLETKMPEYFAKVSHAVLPLVERVAKMKAKIQQATASQKRLKESLKQWMASSEHQSKLNASCNEKINAMTAQNVQMTKKIAEEEKTKAGLESSIASRQAEIEALKAKLKEAETSLKLSLVAQESQKTQIKQMSGDNNALNEVYTKCIEKEIQMQKAVFEATEQAQTAGEKFRQLTAKYRQDKSRVAKMLGDFIGNRVMKALAAQLSSQDGAVKRLVATLMGVKKLKLAHEGTVGSKNANISRLEQAVSALKKESQDVLRQKLELEKRVKQAELEVKERDGSIATKVGLIAKETARAEALEKTLKQAREHNVAVMKVFGAGLKRLHETLAGESKRFLAALSTVTGSKTANAVAKLKASVDHVRGMKEKYVQTKATLNEKLKEVRTLAAELAGLKTRLAETEKALAKSQQDAKLHENAAAQKEKVLVSTQQVLAKTQGEFQTHTHASEQSVKKLQDELTLVQSQVHATEQSLKKTQSDLASTQSHLQASEQNLKKTQGELAAEKVRLEKSVAELKTSKEHYEKTISDLNNASKASKDQQEKAIVQLRTDADKLATQFSSAKEQHENSVARLKAELNVAGEKCGATQKALESSEAKLKEVELSSKRAEAEIVNLKASLGKANETVAEQLKKLNEAAAERTKLSADAETAKADFTKKLQALAGEKAGLAAEIVSVKGDFSIKIKEADGEKAKLKSEIEALKSGSSKKLADLAEEKGKLASELDGVRKELAKKTDEAVVDKAKLVAEIEAVKSALNKKLADLITEKERLSVDIEAVKAELVKKTQETTVEKSKLIGEFETHKNGAEKKLADLASEKAKVAAKLSGEIETLRKELAESKSQCTTLSKEKEAEKKGRRELDEELGSLKLTYEKHKKTASDLEISLKDVQSKLTKSISDRDSLSQSADAKIRSLAAKNGESEVRIKEQDSDIVKLKAQVKGLQEAESGMKKLKAETEEQYRQKVAALEQESASRQRSFETEAAKCQLFESENKDLKASLTASKDVPKDVQKELEQRHQIKSLLSETKEKILSALGRIVGPAMNKAERINEVVGNVAALKLAMEKCRSLTESKDKLIQEKTSEFLELRDKFGALSREKEGILEMLRNTETKLKKEIQGLKTAAAENRAREKQTLEDRIGAMQKTVVQKLRILSEKLEGIQDFGKVTEKLATMSAAWKAKHADIAQRLEEKEQSLETVKASAKALEQTVKDREQAKAESDKIMQETAQKYKAEIEKLRQSLEESRKSLEGNVSTASQKLEAIINQKDQTIADYEDKTKKLEQAITAAEGEKKVLVKQKEQAVAEAEIERKRLEQTLAACEGEKRRLEGLEKGNMQALLEMGEVNKRLEQALAEKEQAIKSTEGGAKLKLEELLKQKDQTIADFEAAKKKFEQTFAVSEGEKKALEASINKKEQALADAEALNKKLEQSYAASEGERHRLEDIIKQKEQVLASAQASKERLEQTLSSSEGGAKQKLEEAIKQKDQAMADALVSKQKLEQVVAEKEHALANFEGAKQKLEEYVKEKDIAMAQLRDIQAKKAAEGATAQEEIEKLKQAVKTLQQQVAERETAKKALEGSVAQHTKEIVELRQQCGTGVEKLKQLQHKLDESIKEKEHAREVSKKELETAKHAFTALEVAKKKLEDTLKEKDKEIIHAKKELTDAQHRYQSETEKLRQSCEAAAKHKLDELSKKKEAETKELMGKFAAKEQEMSAAHSGTVKKKEDEAKQLQHQLELAEYKRQLHETTTQLVKLQGEYDGYKKEIENLKKSHQTLAAEVSELTGKNRGLEQQLSTHTTPVSSDGRSASPSSVSGLKKVLEALQGTRKEGFKATAAVMQQLKEALAKTAGPNSGKETRALVHSASVVVPTAASTASPAHDDRPKYLREILYLCKTFSATEKEHMAAYKGKIEKLNVLITILNEIMDPKVAKDSNKLKAAVTKHIASFPYLKSFDLKTDIKFVVACMSKTVEYKTSHGKKYQAEYESASTRLGIAEQSFKSHDKKLAELTKK